MKKLLLLLIFISGYVAKASNIQIEFISGSNIYVIAIDPATPQIGTITTDASINAIFASYGIGQLLGANSYDYHNTIVAEYGSADVSSLINDLMLNSNVSKVKRCYENTTSSGYTYADQLYVKLFNNTDGNPIGSNASGNVVTTNSAVNPIFDTYDVKSMNHMTGLWYTIAFEGDINGLKNELDAINNGIDTTDLVGIGILANPQFQKPKAVISPNPFSSTFDIETEQTISSYSIIDITGKTIVSTSSKSDFDNHHSQLSAGMYILNLNFDNGQMANYKLVKK
jgi:hypothetical protein